MRNWPGTPVPGRDVWRLWMALGAPTGRPAWHLVWPCACSCVTWPSFITESDADACGANDGVHRSCPSQKTDVFLYRQQSSMIVLFGVWRTWVSKTVRFSHGRGVESGESTCTRRDRTEAAREYPASSSALCELACSVARLHRCCTVGLHAC